MTDKKCDDRFSDAHYENAQERNERALKQRCVPLNEPDDEGTHVDPTTGEHYMECTSCGMMMKDGGDHSVLTAPERAQEIQLLVGSGMECDVCHAINKDD